ncbi:tRNA-binding protein [Candidatus Berkelbacteria bacterium CG10_big_fil_rev_8_21_14_0_10_43_13]|uniref:tRNA-binding protein n=1 Tax=Candidatus Berkelbacteria bacterium CG10_big_fil_rev_8_21_14_0_10_43_13 TaxID=1974514 RepID=A0A2H0W6L8_9BACT|nr:MAG: tRNA-binding protein [Candidatus Berkelbacteria bacterium CG10_big_fil_rev_8_21_14_0_10_43_13]
MIKYEDFEKIDVRIGRIINVEDTSGLRNPSYKMTIDFGPEIGRKISLGQYVSNYSKAELTGKLVMCVVNFEPKKIGHYLSEALTLGFKDENGRVVLAEPEREVSLGEKMF